MAKNERFFRMSALTVDQHQIFIDLDWRYPQLLEYLKVSPSYRLAHLISTGEIERDSCPLPQDFELVEQTYQAFGDVYRTSFTEWWLNIAQFRFGVSAAPKPHTFIRLRHREVVPEVSIYEVRDAFERYTMVERPSEGLPAALVVAIPVSRDRKRMLRDLEALIDREFGPEHEEAAGLSAKLIDNKMRENTMETARRVLFERCLKPDARLFEIGNATGIAPEFWTDEKKQRSDDREIDFKRQMMEITTSRQVHRAYLLAENAARGRFPALDALPSDPNRPGFDYRALGIQLRDDEDWLWDHIPLVDQRAGVLATGWARNARVLHAKQALYRGAEFANVRFEIAHHQDDLKDMPELLDGKAVRVLVKCKWNGATPRLTQALTVFVRGGFTVRWEKNAEVVRIIGRVGGQPASVANATSSLVDALASTGVHGACPKIDTTAG